MAARLIDSLGTTDEMAEVFSDASVLGAMLGFEAALARAQARLGIVPEAAAEAIGRAAASVEGFDAAEIGRASRQSATPVIALVKALTERAGTEFVHWGATSQDVLDTAMVLLLRRAREILARDHARLAAALRGLSEAHASTAMLGRTLLQPAPPVTFGYKAALWRGGVCRSWRRLARAFDESAVLQFGGASGTLASYGDRGLALAEELGRELGLAVPDAPWHTARDRVAAMIAQCGVYTGSLAKIARDVALLMQPEVGEVAAPGGGSSAMPGKRNPSGPAIALAAAARVPGLVAAYLGAMAQEHERAAGGWQSEWQTVAGVVEATAAALAAIAATVEGLTVNVDRMRANLDATPAAFAEQAAMQRAPKIGRAAAQAEVAREVEAGTLRREDGDQYLGSAERFRKQLLEDE